MKTSSILILTATLSLSAFADDKERAVTLDKIPAPAAAAIKKTTGGANLANLSEENDEGKTAYEAKFTKNGRVHEVSVDGEGKLLSDEEVIPVSAAPEAVRKAIDANAGGKVEKLERVKENGKETFEALIAGKNKREEVVFSTDGKVVEREDKTHDKDKD